MEKAQNRTSIAGVIALIYRTFFVYISRMMKNGFCTSTTHHTHMHALTHTPPLLNSYPSYKFPQLKQLNVARFHVAVKS